VLFSPCATAKNGIATYVHELMPYFLARFDVTLVVADDAVLPAEPEKGLRILLAAEFRKHRSFFEKAPKLYHFGNNPDHCYMLDMIVRDPGIVVLHDYNLNYMHEVSSLGWVEPDGYRSALELEYGALGAETMRHRFERKDRGLFATYELPLNGDVLEAASGVIAHSRYVQYKVAARVPRTPVWYIPHHLAPGAETHRGLTKQSARSQLGLPGGALIVTALGFVSYAKKIPLVLASLAELRSTMPPFRFVLAGEKRPGEYDVDADIAAFGLKDITICTNYLQEDQFFKHLVACDLVTNLRHPSGGETSGTLIRALGMGVPTVVLDYGPLGELPNSVVGKVPWGPDTQSGLTDVMRELMSDPAKRHALGANAAAYIRANHNIEKVADAYARVLGNPLGRTKPAAKGSYRQHFPGARELAHRLAVGAKSTERPLQDVDGELWWSRGCVPLGQADQRALVVSPRPVPTSRVLSKFFEWPHEAITCVDPGAFLSKEVRAPDGSPLQAETFTFALVVVPSNLPEVEAALLMRRVNAALRGGGSVALEVWDDSQTDERRAPLAEARLAQCLIDAGFTSARKIDHHSGILADITVPDRDMPGGRRFSCVAARKASSFASWKYMHALRGAPMRYGGRVI
jgi:glycosyltransferase involved in cell wall biosynthesis